jgi:hypothetical protein
VLAIAIGAIAITLLAYTLWVSTMRRGHSRHPRQ